MLWPGSHYVTFWKILEETLLDARKFNGISLKTSCLSEPLRLPRANLCSTAASKKCEALAAKSCPSFSWIGPVEVSTMTKKRYKQEKVWLWAHAYCLIVLTLAVTSCLLYRSGQGYHVLSPAGTFLVFVGPCPFLGTAVTRYPVTGDVEGSHLMLILLSWTSVTCIWDGVSISEQQKKVFLWACWYSKPSSAVPASWISFCSSFARLRCLGQKTHVAIYLILMLAQSKKALTTTCGRLTLYQCQRRICVVSKATKCLDLQLQ